MLLHVVHEVTHGVGGVAPQLGVRLQLGRVCIEAAVLSVIDSRAQVCGHHLRYALHRLRDWRVRVLDARRVLPGSGPQYIGASERINPSLSDELRNRIVGHRAAVNLREGFQRQISRILLLDVREQPVRLKVAHRCHGDAFARERSRKSASEVHSDQGVLGLWVKLPDRAPQPAGVPDAIRFGSMPYVHRAEVGPIRTGVSDPVNNSDVALVP